MSQGEILVTFISLVVLCFTALPWYIRVLSPSSVHSSRASRWPLWLVPLLAVASIAAILKAFAASDVRDAVNYMVMYSLVGAAWLGIGVKFFPMMGLHALDDVALRRNPASGWLFAGALLGLAAAFAGGNIGDGPGWWVVLFSSGLASVCLFLVWMLLNGAVRATQAVVVDRDLGAAIRLGALLLALGAVFGRGAAGNWHGPVPATNDFFTIAAPALLILAPELALSWLFRPSSRQPTSPVIIAGLIPGAGYLAGAAAYLVHLGWWA